MTMRGTSKLSSSAPSHERRAPTVRRVPPPRLLPLLLLLLVLVSSCVSDAPCSWVAAAAATAATAPLEGSKYGRLSASLAATAAAHRGKVSLAHLTFAGNNRQSSDQSFWGGVVAKVIAAQPDRFHAAVESSKTSGIINSKNENEKNEGDVRNGQTDMLLWTGNAVYTDICDSGTELVKPRTPEKIDAQFALLTENRHYATFVNETVRGRNVIGVWDEHDLGLRGAAERNYTQAPQVRDIYLRRIMHDRPDVKQQLSRHPVAVGEIKAGMYHFTTIPAPAGSLLAEVYTNAVCIVALDVVAMRDTFPPFHAALFDPFTGKGRTFGRPKTIAELSGTSAAAAADLLGEAQWTWLEDIIATYVSPKVKHSDTIRTAGEDGGEYDDQQQREECAVTVIASAWQVLLNDNKPFAGWDLFPVARTRLLSLLKQLEASRVLFVSGHAELAEVGGIIAATDDDIEERRGKGFMAVYARHTPLTLHSRALLPFSARHDKTETTATAKDESNNDDDDDDDDVGYYPAAGASGLVEVTSSGLTHSIADAPFIGRLAGWLVGADNNDSATRRRVQSYSPAEVVTRYRDAAALNGGGGGTGARVGGGGTGARVGGGGGGDVARGGASVFRSLSRYLFVSRAVRVERNFGTLQLLTPSALASAFHVSESSNINNSDKKKKKGNVDSKRARAIAAARRALVDESVRVVFSLHSALDGATLIHYETPLNLLPSYRRRRHSRNVAHHQPGRCGDNDGDATNGKGGAATAASAGNYTGLAPFSVHNIPGDVPAIKRTLLSYGCAELPCVHGKFFMLGKMAFILVIVFWLIVGIIVILVSAKLFNEYRIAKAEEAEEAKLKRD